MRNITQTVSVRHCSRASLGTAGGKVPLAHGCDACGQGVRARAAKALRKRQAKYRSRCSARSPRATRRPRRGRPFASPLRRGGETSGVGRRDRRTLCVSGSPSVGSSPAVQLLRADRVSTRAQKRPCADSAHARSLLAQRGRAAGPWPSMGSSSGPSLTKQNLKAPSLLKCRCHDVNETRAVLALW